MSEKEHQAQKQPPTPDPVTDPPPRDAGQAVPAPDNLWRRIKGRLASAGQRLKASALFRTRRRMIVTLLLGIPLLLCLGYWLFGFIIFADAASLVELKGLVQTRHEEETRWEPAAVNQLLWRNDWLRTGDHSTAQLLFFDVSTVDLQENTEVSISQIGKRRGGRGIEVALRVWFGQTAVRAVRFVDPSSSFRVDTPTASTVVRGARFKVDVAQDGTTQIDLEEGSAEIQIGEETVTLVMGERITLDPSGLYETEKIFEPDGEAMFDKVDAAWNADDETFRLALTDTEVNQYLAYVSQQQPDFFLRDTQIWFVEGEARVATTVVEPARFDLSAALGVEVKDGEIKPEVRAVSAGVALPVPGAVLNPALDWVFDQLRDYLTQAYDYIAFTGVEVHDGQLVVEGVKQPDAPEP
jgi:hypothetical protein